MGITPLPESFFALLHDEVMFLTSRPSTSQAVSAQLRIFNPAIPAIPIDSCQFIKTHCLWNLWRNARKMKIILAIHDQFLYFFPIVYLPSFLFSHQNDDPKRSLDPTNIFSTGFYCNLLFRWFLHSGCPDGLILRPYWKNKNLFKKTTTWWPQRGCMKQTPGEMREPPTRCLGPFLSILSHTALHGECHGARNQCGGQWAQHAHFGWWT